MSSSLNALINSSKSCVQKLKFNPLYNEDGSPSYIRASLLAIFALSLILHVILKPSAIDNSSQGTIEDLNITSGNTVVHQSFDPFNKTAQVKPTVGNMQNASSLSNNKALAESSSLVASEDEGWSLLGFDSQEAKENKQLVANRKQALKELSDGAAFINSCGNIKAAFTGCKFSFSKKVSPYYDSNIETVSNAFKITLVAKGEQQKDGCAKFIVNSDGLYQAFDARGIESQKCFLNSVISEQMLSIHHSVDNIANSHTPNGAKLAVNN